MQLQTLYTVRFNDCDPFGHLNNSKYIDYMLNAREDHLKQFYEIELSHFIKQGFGWVVSNHKIQYLRPADCYERVCIQSDLLQADDTSLLVEMRMLDESCTEFKAILWTKFTCVNINTGKKTKHSASFMELVKDMVLQEVDTKKGLKSRLAFLLGKTAAIM